jgi:outer membrane lipoprotein-sorting protein
LKLAVAKFFRLDRRPRSRIHIEPQQELLMITPRLIRLNPISLGALSLIISGFGISSVASAETPEEKGLKIAQSLDRANEGYGSESSTMEMTLVNAHGDKTTRKMKSQILETTTDGDKSRIEFEWPADVKGTRMLTWTHKKDDDDQWLFLPAIKRVKRISSKNKSGSFMGSEFTYEDLGSQEVEKFKHKFLADETMNGRKLWKLERIPTAAESGYSKQITWVDREYNNAVKIEYYDRKGELLKTATFSDYKKFGKFWRIGKLEMVNTQTRKSSILVWQDRKVGASVDSALFESDELEN